MINISSCRRTLFNSGWKFLKMDNGSALSDISSKKTEWEAVELPHDWLIYDTHNLYKSNDGWYSKDFTIESVDDSVYSICFDGVYMDSVVYVNDIEVGIWHNGYCSFEFNISKYLSVGNNNIKVQVRHKEPNTRWYSGAGIFRNVYLKKTSPVFIIEDGVYISTKKIGENFELEVETEVAGDFEKAEVKHTLFDKNQKVIVEFSSNLINNEVNIQKAEILTPEIWSCKTPTLYSLTTEVICNEKVVDEVEYTVGFKTFHFDTEKGFFLNGENVKLKGVCMHHDLGALGAALNENALYRQLLMMKQMGVNSIRCSHNMPSVELMEICNKLGLLVVNEAFDMWELPKTEFDNARFFNDTAYQDVKKWVRRDRNHPSMILWSIGNEIYDTHASERGLEITKMLRDYVLEHDPKKNALATIASNFIAWENAQKCSDELLISGYNYGEYLYDEHHKKYPHWFIYGSETASTVKSRGIYHFPSDAPILMHDDLQCSSLDNSTVGWGSKNAEKSIIDDRDRDFCAGQYIWTGFDYIGEPTPYSTKNSYFGIVDTAGIPKDIYYMYQSHWVDISEKVVLHLLPYWDFNDGQMIDIIAYSNAPRVELFVCGVSQGVKEIDQKHGKTLRAEWKAEYKKGEIKAVAYDEHGNQLAEVINKSFGDSKKIVLNAEKSEVYADGNDLVFVEISTEDANGVYVANARNRVNVEVSGAGRLVGLDNGDSTDYDSYKGTSRRLFSGKLMAIIKTTSNAGVINIKVNSQGLESASIDIISHKSDNVISHDVIESNVKSSPNDEIPVRKIELITDNSREMNKENQSVKVEYRILPDDATYSDVEWKVTNNNGIIVSNASVDVYDGYVVVHAVGDGEFRLRCSCNNGIEIPQVISELEFVVTGMGYAARNPYEFISASLYRFSNSPMNIVKNGAISGINEVAHIGFDNVDFGKHGSNKIRLYIGNSMNRPIPVQIWQGMPDEGNSKLIDTVMFEHNELWDSFDKQEFTLPSKLTGKQTVSVVIEDRVIFGGIEFVHSDYTYEQISAIAYDRIYGDTFTIENEVITGIGNNVFIDFDNMMFDKGIKKVVICGITPNEENSIHIRFSDDNSPSVNQIIEFKKCNGFETHEFVLDSINGKKRVSFGFMPGSNFDFKWFRFEY